MPSTLREKYKGIITVDLDIPLKEDEMSPDFDNPRIVLNTYNKNVKKVRFEDLRFHSQNLLDNNPIDTIPLFGEKASENGYTYPSLRSFLFKNKDGKIVSQLQKNKIYTIEPLVGLPELNEDNGYKDYIGYAYKWEIIIHNNLLSSDGVPAIRTIPWNYVIGPDWEPLDIKAAFSSMTGTQEALLSEWNKKGVSRRTQSLGSPTSVSGTQEGDIHRVPKAGSTDTTNIYTAHSFLEYRPLQSTPSHVIHESVPIPETYKGSNPMPQNGDTITVDVPISDGTTFEQWKNRDVSDYPSGPFKRIRFESNRITNTDGSRHAVYTSTIMAIPDEFDYFKFSELEDGLHSLVTSNKLFNNSGLGVQVRLWISPVKTDGSDEGFSVEEIEDMDSNAQILTSAYMPYQSEEVLLPPLVNTSKIRESKYITFFEDMLVLYGGDTFGNIIYLSDFSNISYFPFKYALDQIPNEIIHIHPFQNVMIVFTRSDVWAIEKLETENEFGVITTDFIAKQVLQNVFIDEHLKNTIKTVGKYIMILLEDKVIFLKPNSFTGDVTDLSYMEVSTPIGAILKEPHTYVANRLKYYNIFDEEDLKFDLYADVDNKDFKIVLSTFIKTISKPYMIEFIFDGITGVWTIYDTLSTGFPIAKSGALTYMKSHPELGGGVTLTDVEGTNKFNIMDKNQAHMDIDQYDYTESNITLNPTDQLKKPINTIINLGNMNISNHLNKRFHEIQYEMTNINSDGVNMAYEFKVDGRPQQTSDRVIMEINNFILDERQQIEFVTLEKRQQLDFETIDKKRQIDFETLEELSNMGFDNFLLDLSRFPISERIITRVAANGRGRIGSFRISFNITNDFEIFRFLIIYKEQTSRKVSQ